MSNQLTMDDQTYYRIVVQGTLDPQWGEYLSGLSISVSGKTSQTATVLSGEIADQSALMGVLNNLSQMGYPILQVENQGCQA